MRVVGFWNQKKKNENEPDIRIYESTEQGEDLGESVGVLWKNKSASGYEYFSGKLEYSAAPENYRRVEEPKVTKDDDIPF